MLKIIYHLVARLPNRYAQRLSQLFLPLLLWTNNREKRVARTNIDLCFTHLSQSERKQLLKKSLAENAKTLFELPGVFHRGGKYSIQLITQTTGEEHFHNALKEKKGVILLAPHLGNWELIVHYFSQFSPLTAMYAPPKQVFLDEIIRKGRQSSGSRLVPTDARGVRSLFKTLKHGGVIGVLPDQQPKHKNAGLFAPFMGHEALTMTLVNNLARRSDATVLLTFAERLKTGYRLHVLPTSNDIKNKDEIIAATALNQGIEKCVKIAPEQYQWTYKRFNKQPQGIVSPYE